MPQTREGTGHPGLADGYNRTIDYLRVSVTDRCNLKCIYCMPKEGARNNEPSALLTADEILRVVRAAQRQGVRKVRLTGGEPLLRPDIVPLVASLKQAGIRDLSLTTNGMLLPGMAARLKAAGLDRVNISLDTLDPERFRAITRGGEIGRVWDAVAGAEEAGLLPIKLNVVVMGGVNDDEVVPFALLTRDNDYHVRFIEYMPVAGNNWDRKRCVPASELKARISAAGVLTPLRFRGLGPSRNYRMEGARGVIGFISPVSDHFCRCCNRLRLTATGILRPCLFDAAGIDAREALRRGCGDVELDSLIRRAAASKPGGHGLDTGDKAHSGLPSMSHIGG